MYKMIERYFNKYVYKDGFVKEIERELNNIYLVNDGISKVIEISSNQFEKMVRSLNYSISPLSGEVNVDFNLFNVFIYEIHNIAVALSACLGINNFEINISLAYNIQKESYYDVDLCDFTKLTTTDLYIILIDTECELQSIGYINWINHNPVDIIKRESGYLVYKITELYKEFLLKRSSVEFYGRDIDAYSSPHFSSVLIHEIFGHSFEEDIFSILIKEYNLMLNENINVANSNQINKLFISKYDDFGKKIDNKCIIKDGQIVNLISAHCTNDLEYSLKNKSLLIRQKLISLKPPKTYEEDIIKKIDNGVYLKTPTYGTLDKYGNVIIGFNAGYQIIDGEIRNMIRPGFVKKQLIDVLKSIKYVGHNTVLDSGICVKKKEKKILLTEGVDLICKVDLLKGINNE